MRQRNSRVIWSVLLAIVVTFSTVFADDNTSSSTTDQAETLALMSPVSAMSGLKSVNVDNILRVQGLYWGKGPISWGTDVKSPDPTDMRVWRKIYGNPNGPIKANPGLQDVTLIYPRGTYTSAPDGVLVVAKFNMVGDSVGGLILGNGLPPDQGQRRILLWLYQNTYTLRYVDWNPDLEHNEAGFALVETIAELEVDPSNKNVVVGIWVEPDGQHVRVMLPSGELTRVYELPSSIFGPNDTKFVYPTIFAGDKMEVVLERIIFMRPATVLARP